MPRRALAASVLVALHLLAPSTAAAGARCQLRGRPWIEGRILGGDATARAVDARRGEIVEAFVSVPGRLDGREVVFSESGERGRTSWDAAGCGPMQVTWRRVEPRLQHELTAAPNKSIAVYANAVVFGPSHGRWIGFDRIEYTESPLPDADGSPSLRLDRVRPSAVAALALAERQTDYRELGTMRLAATVRAGDAEFVTPGAEDAEGGMISDRVFRYTFRSGDDVLGWMTSFFNVPYLFGSAGQGKRNQAERYLGGDCADILVASMRRAGHAMEYSSVGELVGALRRAAGPAVLALAPPGPSGALAPGPSRAPAPGASATPALYFGSDVLPGDLLAIDYVGVRALPRPWDHIVMVVSDSGPGDVPDGRLGPEDIVADSGDAAGLRMVSLAGQLPARVMVLRPPARRAPPR